VDDTDGSPSAAEQVNPQPVAAQSRPPQLAVSQTDVLPPPPECAETSARFPKPITTQTDTIEPVAVGATSPDGTAASPRPLELVVIKRTHSLPRRNARKHPRVSQNQ
jgi:hypothetical protein